MEVHGMKFDVVTVEMFLSGIAAFLVFMYVPVC